MRVTKAILTASKYRCHRCGVAIDATTSYADKMNPIKLAHPENLIALCKKCYVLRLVPGRQGMIGDALMAGIVGVDWRDGCWE